MDEFCAGVQILLKRIESNPEEFKDQGKWEVLTRSVFARKEGIFAEAWGVRALTDAEVDALHAGCVQNYRSEFDAYVMKNIFAEPDQRKHPATSMLTTASMKATALQILNEQFDKQYQGAK